MGAFDPSDSLSALADFANFGEPKTAGDAFLPAELAAKAERFGELPHDIQSSLEALKSLAMRTLEKIPRRQGQELSLGVIA